MEGVGQGLRSSVQTSVATGCWHPGMTECSHGRRRRPLRAGAPPAYSSYLRCYKKNPFFYIFLWKNIKKEIVCPKNSS